MTKLPFHRRASLESATKDKVTTQLTRMKAAGISTSARFFVPPRTLRQQIHRSPFLVKCRQEDREEKRTYISGSSPLFRCLCCSWRRRQLLVGAPLIAAGMKFSSKDAHAEEPYGFDSPVLPHVKFDDRRRAGWYQDLYAKVMEYGMGFYEKEVKRYKMELFRNLKGENKKILEMGIGTGPNIKYYVNTPRTFIYGVDPNKQMEKYARQAAIGLGLPPENFNFVQGVAEALPIRDNSMDVVIGTLVLCSVSNILTALNEVKRVLKPGGLYIFIEHVAAKDGSFLRVLQTVLDPLQQFVSDGCHLTRETGKNISEAGFSDVQISSTSIVLGPHIYGIAIK